MEAAKGDQLNKLVLSFNDLYSQSHYVTLARLTIQLCQTTKDMPASINTCGCSLTTRKDCMKKPTCKQ